MEIKRVTEDFGDRSLISWTPDEIKCTMDTIETLFEECDAELAKAGMSSLGYEKQDIGTMIEHMVILIGYVYDAHPQCYCELDKPLFKAFKNGATETLSNIVLDDITTENTFGMQEYVEVPETVGSWYMTEVKTKLTMSDFLGLEESLTELAEEELAGIKKVDSKQSLDALGYAEGKGIKAVKGEGGIKASIADVDAPKNTIGKQKASLEESLTKLAEEELAGIKKVDNKQSLDALGYADGKGIKAVKGEEGIKASIIDVDAPKSTAGKPKVTKNKNLSGTTPKEVPEVNSSQTVNKVSYDEEVPIKNLKDEGGTGERLIPGMEGVVTGGDSTKLGKNMMESMGLPRGTNWTGHQAQHIIPAEMENHPVLQKIGMDLDDASNGLFLKTPADDISTMSRHRGYHSTYNEFVKTQLDAMDINQSVDVLQKQVYDLQQNLKYLQQSGLPLYPSQGATVDLWQRSLERIQ